MPSHLSAARYWQFIFFGLLVGYCLYYAPYGINETDGGFLTGLAWQVLSGKTLYQDIVYVRPPIPVWLRALEIQYLPESWAIMGERWIFYGKLALYSWLGAAALTKGTNRWIIAVFGFVVSAHCYPPMAWHTVDGILLAVLAVWLLSKDLAWTVFFSGLILAGSLLCKQSFYPLLPVFLIFTALGRVRPIYSAGLFLSGFVLGTGLFAFSLWNQGTLASFVEMTAGAASGNQAMEHGILDYFRITPELAIPGLMLLLPAFYWNDKKANPNLALFFWGIWLLALPLSYAAITWFRQDHTVPFAQSRAMFVLAVWCLASQPAAIEGRSLKQRIFENLRHQRLAWLLMAVSWSAAVSWGYNLPILFATPWIWAAMQCTHMFSKASTIKYPKQILSAAYLLLLLLAFRVGYSFVYRDGKRCEMNHDLGRIFPALQGIYSDDETAEKYMALKTLAERYPNFAVLPAFPQANFLSQTFPPLPLNWVVNRETNGNNDLVEEAIRQKKPVLLIQKNFLEKIPVDPELTLTRYYMEKGNLLEETQHFLVIQPNNEQ
jgi:hypothetical protein